MPLLSIKHCLDILQKNEVPQNIVDHSLKVNQIAMYLGEKLVKAGEKVNLNLLNEASLLHDIDKHLSFFGKKKHGEEAPKILEEEEMQSIIPIVSKHHLHNILENGKKGLNSWEEKLVYYADKRVVHDKIVSIDERFAYLKKRYGQTNKTFLETIEKCYPKVKELEKEIFEKIGISSELTGLN